MASASLPAHKQRPCLGDHSMISSSFSSVAGTGAGGTTAGGASATKLLPLTSASGGASARAARPGSPPCSMACSSRQTTRQTPQNPHLRTHRTLLSPSSVAGQRSCLQAATSRDSRTSACPTPARCRHSPLSAPRRRRPPRYRHLHHWNGPWVQRAAPQWPFARRRRARRASLGGRRAAMATPSLPPLQWLLLRRPRRGRPSRTRAA